MRNNRGKTSESARDKAALSKGPFPSPSVRARRREMAAITWPEDASLRGGPDGEQVSPSAPPRKAASPALSPAAPFPSCYQFKRADFLGFL